MSKRRAEETDEQRWLRKKKKYEAKLRRGRKSTIIYSDEEQNEANWEPEQYSNIDDEEVVFSAFDVEPETEVSNGPPPPQDSLSREDLPATVEPQLEPTVLPETSVTPPEAPVASDGALDVDPELLGALGAFEEETTEWGDPIVDHIAMRLKPLLTSGFKKDEKDTLIKKYPLPNNVKLAKAPTLNAEVSAMLTEPSRNRDKRLYNKQNQLGSVLSAVTKAMSLLLCKDPKIVNILSILSDASKLLADSHYLETDTRRSLIIPLVDKELIEPFKERKRDDFLFGENLGEMVKNSRGIKRTGQFIQASTSSNLNYKGPSSRGRPQKNNYYANRAGGQQRSYRRAAPGPPPGAPRRQPPPAQTQYAPPRRRPPPASVVAAPRNAPTTTYRATATTGTQP